MAAGTIVNQNVWELFVGIEINSGKILTPISA